MEFLANIFKGGFNAFFTVCIDEEHMSVSAFQFSKQKVEKKNRPIPIVISLDELEQQLGLSCSSEAIQNEKSLLKGPIPWKKGRLHRLQNLSLTCEILCWQPGIYDDWVMIGLR